MHLTLFAIQNAKAKEKPYRLADGDGLYLLVHPSGSKHWRFRYTFSGKENILASLRKPSKSRRQVPAGRTRIRLSFSERAIEHER
jgi:hypothetical protein